MSLGGLVVPGIVVAVCLGVLYAVRWPLTVLAAGDDEAHTLGVSRRLVWLLVVTATTLMTAIVVSIAGSSAGSGWSSRTWPGSSADHCSPGCCPSRRCSEPDTCLP